MRGRVLVADDNAIVRRTLRHLLEEAGVADVDEAEDGWRAVSQAAERQPNVVILDLAMPRMDGLNAAREISKLLPQTAILMYTMHWSPHLELEAKRCGVRMLVSKAQSSVLLRAVKDLLGNKNNPAGVVEAVSVGALSGDKAQSRASDAPGPEPIKPKAVTEG